ncbi:hypothetical protein LC087_16810 [Bacillus carboniphilus]|uniref:ABC transporter permease n=1 Tax=Bacillus carboniphilus TaxID=86663 RepID=A0ABY9JVP6_9BACI|nr:hypothetical protein [Bacillus carboniphilus]WLR42348.1 hypothetical protein LC087_16810 [Bacillus carboniphilus]
MKNSGELLTLQLYMNELKKIMKDNELVFSNSVSRENFMESYGPFSIHYVSNWIDLSIAIAVVTLLIYVFFIWYRDWLGKNTFSYRLLMLPTARINIYFAKATTILICILGLLALQVLLLPIESTIIKSLVPSEFRADLPIYDINNSSSLVLFLPGTFLDFLLYYGFGTVCVFVVFTAILFERSYRIKGIIWGALYCVVSFVIFLLPLIVDAFLLDYYFYLLDLLLIEAGVALLILASSIWTSNYLLKNKMRG